jgi:hypothetical protein
MAGQAHLGLSHNIPGLHKLRDGRASVLDKKSIHPAIMANGAFFCGICLTGNGRLLSASLAAKAEVDGKECQYQEY